MEFSPEEMADRADIEFTRVFSAPALALFHSMTNPKHLTHFWGPVEVIAPGGRMIVEPRKGGRFEVVMIDDATGSEFPNAGVYLEVTEPTVISWREPLVDLTSTTTFTQLDDGRTRAVIYQSERSSPLPLPRSARRYGEQLRSARVLPLDRHRSLGTNASSTTPRHHASLKGHQMGISDLAPATVLRDESDLPFIDLGDGSLLQLTQGDLAQGIWVIRNRFLPGVRVQTHRHTGSVYALTVSGAWHYLETAGSLCTEGSYLFEPAGSTHTLHVLDENTGPTELFFTIHGANLNLDANGKVDYVFDACSVLGFYRAACAEQLGITDPPVVICDL